MLLTEISTSIIVSLVWVGVMLFFIGIEASTSALVSIWFAGGALAAALVSIFTSNTIVLALVFVVVSVLLLLLFRKKAIEQNKGAVQTNADALIGKTAKIASVSENDVRVLVSQGDTTWNAVCDAPESFAVGETVKITEIVGNKLKIEKEKEKE